MDATVKDVRRKIFSGARKIFTKSMKTVARSLPNEQERKKFLEHLHEAAEEEISAAVDSGDYERILNRGAYETSVWLAEHYADAALKRACKEFPRGKTRNKIHDALEEMAHSGIESYCRGEDLEVIKAELEAIAKTHMKRYVEEQSKVLSKQVGQKIYMRIKFKGKGSREPNRYLRHGRDIFAEEFSASITDNFGAWLDGEKDFGEATVDIVANTAKNTAVRYTKEKGAEIAAQGMKHLAELAEKKIQNELARNATVWTLNKLADSNTLTSVVGVGIDFKKMLNGEISKAEFLRRLGEKGTSAVVSGACASLGTMIVGKSVTVLSWTIAGGAIGAAVGYFATKMVFNSLLQAFEEAERSRKEYEAFHGFCEYAIPELERQRLELERAVEEFLTARQQTFERASKQRDSALKVGNMDVAVAAANEIAEGRLPYQTGAELERRTRNLFS